MNADFKLVFAAAKKKYKTFSSMYCPLLDFDIYFNNIGFKHLIWKGLARRPDSQVFQRLSLIPLIPEIVEKANRIGRSYSRIENCKLTHYWGIERDYAKKTIRIVIRQNGNSRRYFYSILSFPTKNLA